MRPATCQVPLFEPFSSGEVVIRASDTRSAMTAQRRIFLGSRSQVKCTETKGMIETNCHACHRYDVLEAPEVAARTLPDSSCRFRQRHPDRVSTTYGCQGYRPWLQVAQEVLHKHVRIIHKELNDPSCGYWSPLGSLNRRGRDLLAHAHELEALLRQSEAIPHTTAKPRLLMETVTPSVPEYAGALRQMLATSNDDAGRRQVLVGLSLGR